MHAALRHLGIAACSLLVRLTNAQNTTGVCVGFTGYEPVGEQVPILMALPGLGMVTGNCFAFAASFPLQHFGCCMQSEPCMTAVFTPDLHVAGGHWQTTCRL